MKYRNTLKRTWDVIIDSIGKAKSIKKFFPQKVITNNKIVADTDVIANITEIWPNLSKKVETPATTFEGYLEKENIIQPENPLNINELKDVFFSLKNNKSPGHDGISCIVIRNCFGPLSTPLLSIFNASLQTGIFPGKLQIARVTPISQKSCKNYV